MKMIFKITFNVEYNYGLVINSQYIICQKYLQSVLNTKVKLTQS